MLLHVGWARVLGTLGVVVLGLGLAGAATAQPTTCAPGDGSRVIKTLQAVYDPGTQEVVVSMTLCAAADGSSKYRVRFDTVLNQVEWPAGSGTFVPATVLDGNPSCLASDDAGAMWANGKAVGVGTATVTNDIVTFRVGLADFSPAVPVGATVRVWGDIQYRGIADVAPTVDAADGCARPQFPGETLAVSTRAANAVVGTQLIDVRRSPSRLTESAMGNLVADALRDADPSADVALTNSGGLRADLLMAPPSAGEQPGEITWGELFAVLPFGNLRVSVTVTGAQLAADLTQGLSASCNPAMGTGRFPQVSGLRLVFSCAGPTANLQSLERVAADGGVVPVGAADLVRVVTNDFMLAGGDGYAHLGLGTNVSWGYETILDAVARFVTATSPIAPVVDGRIVKQ